MDLIRIYFDFFYLFFSFLSLDLITSVKNKHYNTKTVPFVRIGALIFILIYSIPTGNNYSFIFPIIGCFLYVLILSSGSIRNSLLHFLVFELYEVCLTILLSFIQYILIDMRFSIGSNHYYLNYKSLISSALAYIFLCLFLYSKRLFSLRKGRFYSIIFIFACVLSAVVLSYLSLFSYTGQLDITYAFPLIFSFIFIVIAICLNSYNRIVVDMEKDAQQTLLISKYEMKAEYYNNVNTALENLARLRHDFKNHLIVLDNYAQGNDMEGIQNYVKKVSGTLSATQLIRTPSSIVSAILNTKSTLCQHEKIDFHCTCSFTALAVGDFHMITILGNLLDNAIEASRKTTHGTIDFAMQQIDSYLSITCNNNYMGRIVKKGEHFISTKNTGEIRHGFGIKNIQDSVHKLNGSLDIQYDATTFCVAILIPNYH